MSQAQAPTGGAARRRQFRGTPGRVIRWVTILFAIFVVLYISGALQYLDIFIFPQRYDAIFFAFALAATFLFLPATKNSPRNKVPWYDIIAIILGIAVNVYIVLNALEITLRPYRPPTVLEQIFGLIDVLLILEGVRRSVGLSLTIVGLVFIAYPFVTQYLPGFLEGRNQSFSRVMELVYVFPRGIYGGLLHLLAGTIVMFLIFGAFLQVSGAGNFLVELAYASLGRYRGGPAKVSVLASSLFGMVNGSPIANVSAVGVITIPMMKRVGYEPYYAGAIEAVASSGGQIMPPVLGVVAFLMVEFLGIPYGAIAAAAVFPALLYYAALFIMIDLQAVKTGLRGLPPSQLPSIMKPLKEGGVYLLPLVLLVVFLLMGYSPETSCLYSILALLIVVAPFKRLRMGLKKIGEALYQAMNSVPELGTVLTMSGILLASMELTGVGVRLTGGLVQIAGGSMFILLVVTAVAALFLGLALPGSGVYVLCALLLAPALVKSGMQPLVAHFFVFYYGAAAVLTPPVCLTAFVAASIAGAPMMKTGWTAMRLGIIAFIVPFMFAYAPQLLLLGTPLQIVLAFVVGLVGVFLLSCGLEGYFIRKTNWPQRIALTAGGLLTIVPHQYTIIAGLLVGIAVFLFQFLRRHRAPPTGPAPS